MTCLLCLPVSVFNRKFPVRKLAISGRDFRLPDIFQEVISHTVYVARTFCIGITEGYLVKRMRSSELNKRHFKEDSLTPTPTIAPGCRKYLKVSK